MKKIILVSTLVAVAGMANAAGGNLTQGSNDVTTSNCTLLSAAVKITLSTSNVGAYDCDTSTSSIGIAVSNSSGKNKSYSLGSAGGAIVVDDLTAAATSGAALTGYATSRSASS